MALQRQEATSAVEQSDTSHLMASPSAQLAHSLTVLEDLYELYHRQGIGLAYRLLGERGEAEEVVQEALLAAWRAAGSYDTMKGSTRTWFLSLVRHRAIDALRSRTRRPRLAVNADADWADACDTAERASTQADAEAVRLAFAQLPVLQRQVMELAYFCGLTHTEIATRLAIPVGTVKGRLRLGLDRLRSELGVPRGQGLAA